MSVENENGRDEVKRLQNRLDDLKDQNEDKNMQCEKLRDRVNELIEDTKSKERSLSDSETRLSKLRAQCQELVVLRSRNGETISILNQALNSKKQETRKLHDIILQSGQTESAFSDEDLVKNFQKLSYNILRVVKKHYLGRAKKLKWKDTYNNLSPETRELWVRAMIADKLHIGFFSSSSRKLFGFDEPRESALAELEGIVAASGKGESF
jgi:chromosome segregation ATPase